MNDSLKLLDAPITTAKPFLKWAGGKSQLLPQYAPLFPKKFNTYFEPFLGGGAVFFYLAPQKAILSDINKELISTYNVVKNGVEELILELKKHKQKNKEKYYYRIRDLDPDALSPVERAARLIYLNKTCYNGLYRVNSQGKFNVPFSSYKNPLICDEEGLRAASFALQSADFRVGDFEEITFNLAKPEDFIYLDPPYYPLSDTANFTGYIPEGFGKREQERLAGIYKKLDKLGCYLMLSNSDTPFIRELYRGFLIETVEAGRAINSKAEGRGKITELVILNY